LNRRPGVYLALFSAWYFALAIAQASTRPLWHDELFTAYLSRVPTAGHLWDALVSGVDLMPPLYHLIVRAEAPVLGDSALVLRLPSLIGFWVMCLCLYRYVTRSLPAEFGFAAMLLPLCTSGAYYMAEARPYGWVLGLASVALVSWQALGGRSRRWFWLTSLVLSLAAAIGSHYYAVLLLFPLALGEVARTVRRRSIDWIVWAGLTAPLAVLLPLLPLLRTVREFAPTFWTSPRIGEAVLVYRTWFGHSDWVFVLLAAIAAAALLLRHENSSEPTRQPPIADLVPALGLLALPFIGALIAFVTRSGFASRYVLPGILGLAIAGSFALARLAGRSAALRLATVFVLLFNYELLFSSRDVIAAATRPPATTAVERRLLDLDASVPIVVTSPHAFLKLYHYAPAEVGRRLRYVADAQHAYRGAGTDTADRALLLLARQVPLPVARYPDGLQSQPRYYVLDVGPLNWLVPELLTRQTTLTLVASGEDFALYDARPAKEPER
jgi:hypothetical protein